MDPFPMPSFDSIIEILKKIKIFDDFRLMQTSFVTQDCQWQFKGMSFGLKNVTATLNRLWKEFYKNIQIMLDLL